ncbi:MAG: hypothetical protein P8Z74_04600 [Acidobacteriota bacterium]
MGKCLGIACRLALLDGYSPLNRAATPELRMGQREGGASIQ